MNTLEIIWNLAVTGVLVLVPLSAAARLALAVFSPRARRSIRKHPVAHSFWFAGGLLLGFLLLVIYAHGRAETRARFNNLMNDLKEADLELRWHGSVTNDFHYSRVYPSTNCYVIGGTNYQCEFFGEREEFRDRGILAITTNQIFVWIDNKRGAIPLLRRELPPGI